MSDIVITPRRTAIQVGGFADIDATGRADDYIAILESAERLPIVVANREARTNSWTSRQATLSGMLAVALAAQSTNLLGAVPMPLVLTPARR